MLGTGLNLESINFFLNWDKILILVLKLIFIQTEAAIKTHRCGGGRVSDFSLVAEPDDGGGGAGSGHPALHCPVLA